MYVCMYVGSHLLGPIAADIVHGNGAAAAAAWTLSLPSTGTLLGPRRIRYYLTYMFALHQGPYSTGSRPT
jgi:hypothetical protein